MSPVPGDGEFADGRPGEGAEPPPVVRDKRRIDPETGEVRQPSEPAAAHQPPAPDGQPAANAAGAEPDSAPSPAGAASAGGDGTSASADASGADADALGGAAAVLAEERLADLQRLQAEFVNYRRRVERDRNVARDSATAALLEALLPALDDIELARQHGDLADGPFAAIAEKLEGALGRFGLSRYGAAGEEFDPTVHEALLHSHSADVTVTTVTQILQPGYKLGEKVLRPARVGVSDPE